MKQNLYQREIVFHKEFFWSFYKTLDPKVQNKVEWTLGLVRDLKMIPSRYFKSIKGAKGLYEIRIQFGTDAYRIFCLLTEHPSVVLLNGFKKKANRTPKREIEKAINLKFEYFDDKRD